MLGTALLAHRAGASLICILRVLLPVFCLLSIAASGCTTRDCGGTWCARITNEHQENAQPVHIMIHQAPSALGGMGLLDAARVFGRQLAPGTNTGWFDASEGTSRDCGGHSICFQWRANPDEAWSAEISCGEPANVPTCLEEGNSYDMILL